MGLAGRKTKQRIGADPRNLTWSDDSSKFGAKYLQSLGWTSGTGLGAAGEGRISNLKIHQKLDLMGIGANRRGPGKDDTDWRGGREFEGLLARLNQAQEDTPTIPLDGKEATAVRGTIEHYDDTANDQSLETRNSAQDESVANMKEKEKKRKRTAVESEVDLKDVKRRRKEEKKEKKEEKEKKKAEKATKKWRTGEDSKVQEQTAESILATPIPETAEAVKTTPRYRAHRARHLSSKRLASASTTGMNEILGISSTALSASGTSSTPFPSQGTSAWQSSQMGVESNDAGFGLMGTRRLLEEAAEANDAHTTSISEMGLGSNPTMGGGLGFRRAKVEIMTPESTRGNDANELIRKSGKSVAEYFAEKIRIKKTASHKAGR
ncbi:hypothetical protein K439DRAFT_540963 [Ramaria rubella]|nr:hypothetical protein K439DRAFT_540963 [Ramaria rubella]